MNLTLNAASRLLAHKDGEEWVPGVRGYHYAVGCLLLAADTLNFSFQLRAPGSDTPNTWGCWGGSIDGNEEAFAALKRELKEETGYTGETRIYPLMTNYNQDRQFQYYNNLVLIPHQFEVNPPPEFAKESAGNTWVQYNEWPTPLHPGLQELLDDRTSMNTVEQVIENIDRANLKGADPMKLAAAQRLLTLW
jgi:8-oxo-dGTP pyrophosphatase MutT (NUDIX family)